MQTLVESDSLGVVEVPADKLWGAQTQRSLEHFSIGSDLIPREMITAYAILKKAAAAANQSGKRLDDQRYKISSPPTCNTNCPNIVTSMTVLGMKKPRVHLSKRAGGGYSTSNLRTAQLLREHSKIVSTVGYLGIQIDDAIETALKVGI